MLNYCDIIKEDNPDLRVKCEPVSLPLSKEDEETLFKMNEYLVAGYDEKLVKKYDIRPGVGLAAPQIDVLKRMFVICAFDEDGELHHYGVINPKIVSQSIALTYLPMGEGCLSVDRSVQGLIHRPKKIKVRCHIYDFKDKEVFEAEIKLKDYIAVVFQHENDHLNGVLFIDHINKSDPFFVPENSTPIVFKVEDDEKWITKKK